MEQSAKYSSPIFKISKIDVNKPYSVVKYKDLTNNYLFISISRFKKKFTYPSAKRLQGCITLEKSD